MLRRLVTNFVTDAAYVGWAADPACFDDAPMAWVWTSVGLSTSRSQEHAMTIALADGAAKTGTPRNTPAGSTDVLEVRRT